MSNYAANEYIECKKWISDRLNDGSTWEDVRRLCVAPGKEEQEFFRLKEDELIIPDNMKFEEWCDFVAYVKSGYSRITEMYGLSDGSENGNLPVPIELGSPWVKYKNYLLGRTDGKVRIDDYSVTQIENNCHWILNRLSRDTRTTGPKKGLVMGSVQSGKTANMIGLTTMTAYYDWNFVIILSGTIDNLRKQTRDRFHNDLSASGGLITWHVLDKTGNPTYMIDTQTDEKFTTDDLKLNRYQDGKSSNQWMHRYVTVCLKNSTRLRNLIRWLQSNPTRAAKLRILVIDDEADQASVNTRKMKPNETDEELIERTAVNQLIIDLVNGKNEEGAPSSATFQAMNYISFTATPYANVLNEAYDTSLYPKNFICSLPESKSYFGAKVIFGSAEDEKYPGLDIVRNVSPDEISELKNLHSGNSVILPEGLQKSVCWFFCASAVLRCRGHKKPISMLIHTTALQNGHFEEYDALKSWLIRERSTGSIITLCKQVYESEKERLTPEKLKDAYPDYALIDNVNGDFPDFDKIKHEIEILLSDINNIMLDDDKELVYNENAVHLCVDNCRANRVTEDGAYLRIVYPSHSQLDKMKKAPVFIVMGGNTLARGLTVEGLVCTYFGRNVNQADTLMQMARWFGYRAGYELLQRMWMPLDVQRKFELLEKIDEKLKAEFEDFMTKGKSPGEYGPRITSTASIARFLITSKNKSQNAVECDFDFSGSSYEVTEFENRSELKNNIIITEEFLDKLGNAYLSEKRGSYYWKDIDFELINNEFFKKYHIFDCSSLKTDIPVFTEWMKQMNDDGKYLKWNVAVSGDRNAPSKWKIGEYSVGKIERNKKTRYEYIDIGSLRSGADALCDVESTKLKPEQLKLYNETLRTRKNILSVRGEIGLSDTPILLLYRIDKDRGRTSPAGTRTKINSICDVIGFSIIIPGESSGKSHARAVTVRIPY